MYIFVHVTQLKRLWNFSIPHWRGS